MILGVESRSQWKLVAKGHCKVGRARIAHGGIRRSGTEGVSALLITNFLHLCFIISLIFDLKRY